MEKIEQAIKKLGYKKIGKDCFGQQMFKKGNAVIHLSRSTFKKQKEETFKQVSNRIFNIIN